MRPANPAPTIRTLLLVAIGFEVVLADMLIEFKLEYLGFQYFSSKHLVFIRLRRCMHATSTAGDILMSGMTVAIAYASSRDTAPQSLAVVGSASADG